ncbi:MAG: UDP-N-acetylglucosamine--N-acetylmuramyl-(pentapeptide) pyrophosphoryl-undecaprenol N-acetylglucosamine transferase [Candidatus Omnitrophota bacterium]|jgi:UDP-N-acetylglucosamine--N-acetylmuramyl-(pentapeptide) pyrophosphoryl-undecaprenol N-acetylglucosamine transferase
MMKSIIIIAGGSAGHVYPALDLIKQLNLQKKWRIILVTDARGKALLPHDADFEIYLSLMPRYHGRRSVFNPLFWFKLIREAITARAMMYKHSVILSMSFGGFLAIPWILMAKLIRVQTCLHEQNAKPGKANALLLKWVDHVYTVFKNPIIKSNSRQTCVWTGFATPKKAEPISAEEARTSLDLDRDKKTLLVFGGSQGALALNECIANFMQLFGHEFAHNWQCLQLTGINKLTTTNAVTGMKWVRKEYLDNMNLAYSASDLAVTRAGASTIHELAYFELPSLLVPYPHAGQHQMHNAEAVSKAPLFDVIDQKKLTAEIIRNSMLQLGQVGKDGISEFSVIKFDEESSLIARDLIKFINQSMETQNV